MCFREVCLQYQQLFERGVAWDKIILKTLARIPSFELGSPALRNPSLLRIKLFFGPFSLMLYLDGFLFFSVMFGIPPFFTNLFRLVTILALLLEFNLFFRTGAPFNFVKVFCKDPFLALYFSLFSSMISLLLCLFPSAVLFMLISWPFGRPLLRTLLIWRLFKEL